MRLVVVYDQGAVHPTEISRSMQPHGEVVFAAVDSMHTRRLMPLLQTLATVVPVPAVGDLGEAVRAIAELRPDGIVTFSEHGIRPTSRLASQLDLPYHDEATTVRLTDKAAQRSSLRSAGVDSTRSAVLCPTDGRFAAETVERAVGVTGFPAVLKPARGGGSRSTHLVTSSEELWQLLRSPGASFASENFVLEEFLVGADTPEGIGDFVSVESFVRGDRVVEVAVAGKLPLASPFREVGQFWPPVSTDDLPAIRTLVTTAIQSLGIRNGFVHTEIKLTKSGPRLIEVNGRLGGHVNELALRATGTDLVLKACLDAVGAEPAVETLAPSEVFWQWHAIAPQTPCIVSAPTGWRECLQIDGVTSFVPYIKAGQAMAGGVQTSHLNLVCGHAADHSEMLGQIQQVERLLRYTFEPPQTRSAEDLTELAAQP